MTKKSKAYLLAVLTLTILLTGCINLKSAPPTIINAEIRASEDVNPDDTGRPSPIIVRIYSLKSVGTFNASDFYTIYNDENQLGKDLVNREEIQLRPGGQKIFSRELSPEVQYLGIVAAYRQLTQSLWKETVPVPGGRTTNFSVQLNKNTISIQYE